MLPDALGKLLPASSARRSGAGWWWTRESGRGEVLQCTAVLHDALLGPLAVEVVVQVTVTKSAFQRTLRLCVAAGDDGKIVGNEGVLLTR
jgi:hypothetical protein